MLIRNVVRVVVIAGCIAATALPFLSAQDLPRVTPESQGVDSAKLIEFLRIADEEVNSMHSFMMLRSGNVVAEAWWSPEGSEKPHGMWSLSKSFTSTARDSRLAASRKPDDRR